MLSILILILVVITIVASTTVVMKRKQNSGGTNRFFSVSSMADKLLLLVKRFPISLLLVIGLAVLFFVAINTDFDDVPYQLWIFFSIGAFLSVLATLFTEDFFNYLKTYGVALLVTLLWGVYCYLLPEKDDELLIGKGIEIFIIGGTAFFAMAFISFLKKNKDRAFWNFATQLFFQVVLACVFGGILFGGLSLALVALDQLFSISIEEEVYGNLAVVCLVLFSPVYFLANIPNKSAKYNDEIFYTKIQKILSLYILTPILAVYVVILYAYLFKIIITWELPDGWVSWLVSALAFGGLLVITLLYPVHQQEKNKLVSFLSRWFGLLILPLLALMTVGIFRRIGDYGITINRGYILLLNLWFYAIYIYLFFSKSLHIKWILISFSLVALLASVNSWGIAHITKKSLTKEVSAVLNKQVSSEEAKVLLAGMTQSEKERMKSALEYLNRNFGKESVQPFFTDSVSANSWSFLSELGLSEILEEESKWFYYQSKQEKKWSIEGYHTFTRINYSHYGRDDDDFLKNDTIEIMDDNRTIAIPMREIILSYLATEEKIRNEQTWIVQGQDYKVLIRNFSGNYYPAKDSIAILELDGYLLYK